MPRQPGNPSSETWIVVPVFNEEGRLGAVLEELEIRGMTVVVVDDCSSDASAAIADRKASWCLRHSVNLGQGAALQTGIRFALEHGAEVIVTFDADGQHDPDDISVLVNALTPNVVDFALGSRFLGEARGIPLMRRMLLRLAVGFTRLLSGIAVTDTHNGLRAMTRHGANRIHLTMNRMEHASEFLDQIVESGLNYVEVPVRILYTEYSLGKGQRNMNAFRMATKLLVERLR